MTFPLPPGPDIEQLDLAEDVARLTEIGNLILSGHAQLEDFGLTKWELVFMDGFLNGAEHE